MGAQRLPLPITVADYERIPDPPGGRLELHHGEVAFVTFPAHEHKAMQRRLRRLLEAELEPRGYIVDTEFPYRPFPENEVWGADFAVLAVARYDAIEKWLAGSPELTVEVKSASNTEAEMHDKAMTTLAGSGASEFWIVDPEAATVTVYSKDRGIEVHRGDEPLPLSFRGGMLCATSELFSR